MLKTGASLVVAADGSSENSQKEYYIAGETQQIATRRSSNVNGRKRKRRPENSVISSSNIDNDNKQYWRGHVDGDDTAAGGNTNSREETTNTNQKLRRRKQPAVREPLAALEKEQKLYEIRDKHRQELRSDDAITKNRDKSYRRPYSQAKKEHESTLSLPAPTSTDLKHILKNSGGLSLSEILQQKNLSLDDLLKGKQNALLALQTTAESPTHQKSDHFKNLKPARRIPPGYVGGASTELENHSNEPNSNEETQSVKNKLKFPTLNRIKLFGTSSRATAIPLPGSNVETATKKREHISSTTTSTVKPSPTTRIPIYKKRAHQRSTLKPLLRFKVTTESTAAVAVEMETTIETPTTTTTKLTTVTTQKPIDNDYETELTEIADDNMESEEISTMVETTTIDHVSVMTTMPTVQSSTTATSTTPITSTPPKPTTTPITANSSSRRNRYGGSARQRNRTKQKQDIGEQNLKSNSIESTHQQSNESKETEDIENNSTEFDELENFFEEASRASNERRIEEELNDTTVESITARIDRTNHHQRYHHTSSSSFRTTSTTPAASLEEPLPDFDGIDDRTDLLELIEDRRSGNRLFKVLQQRNMTLDQLIEHRKRGSSQLHLATVVEQNARSQLFPGQKVILHDNMDIVTAFENFPHFNLLNLKSVKPDDIKTDSQGSSYFTSIIDIEPTDEIYKDASKNADGDGSLRGPRYTQQQPLRTDKSLGFFPSWKTLALASLTSTTKGNPFFLSQPKLLLDESNSNELNNENQLFNNTETSASSSEESSENNSNNKISINTIIERDNAGEAIENEVERAHDLLDLELSGHAFKRSPAAASMMKQKYNSASYLYSNMPAGIRSAIVASAAIVLTSMATFLVIFVVCRLKQRKRNKTTNYLRTYNSMKSKMPISSTSPGLTTTSLGKLSTNSASNSRRSSLRNSLVENLITSDGVGRSGSGGGVGISEISSSLMNVATISSNTNKRSNELLFPRRDINIGNNTNQAHLKTCTKNLVCGRRGSSFGGGSRSSYAGDISNNNGGFSSVTGSTSSLALSLRSAHNISSTKLNTMDPNSPEVQEYLFDTLRKSFN